MWAVAVMIAILGLVLTILVHGLLFVSTRWLGEMVDRRRRRHANAAVEQPTTT